MKQVSGHPRAVAAVLTTATALFTAGCSVVGLRTTEEAPYRVLREDGKFELREYDELVVIETVVDTDYDSAGGIAFRRLFGYISGDNVAGDKIAMTAPVLADPSSPAEGEQLERTAPMLGERQADGWRYAFVLPAAITWDRAPTPTNPDVKLTFVPRSKVAAVRYSGLASEEDLHEKSEGLLAWIEDEGFAATSAPRAAGFDPPWTIPFLRRNEVWIDVE